MSKKMQRSIFSSRGKLPTKLPKKKTTMREADREEFEIDEMHTREAALRTRTNVFPCTAAEGTSMHVPNFREHFAHILNPEAEIPDMGRMKKSDGITVLGDFLNLTDFTSNPVTFWLLDNIYEAIKESQISEMIKETQKMCLIWITYVLKEISVNGPHRQGLFEHLDGLLQKADRIVGDTGVLPNPYDLETMPDEPPPEASPGEEAGAKREDEKKEDVKAEEAKKEEKKDEVKKGEGKKLKKTGSKGGDRKKSSGTSRLKKPQSQPQLDRKCRDKDFNLLIDQIYSTFANRFKYEVIRKVFFRDDFMEHKQMCDVFLNPKPVEVVRNLSTGARKSHGHALSPDRSPQKGKPKSKTPGRAKTEKDLFMDEFLTSLETPKVKIKEGPKKQTRALFLKPLVSAVGPSFVQKSAWQRVESDFSFNESKNNVIEGRKQRPFSS